MKTEVGTDGVKLPIRHNDEGEPRVVIPGEQFLQTMNRGIALAEGGLAAVISANAAFESGFTLCVVGIRFSARLG